MYNGNRYRSNRKFNNRSPRQAVRKIRSLSLEELEKVVSNSKMSLAQAPDILESTSSFNDFQVSDLIKANIKGKGYINPTPIQEQAIPYIINGRDVIGMANTGTGKTAAFLIPLLDKVSKDRTQKVLIVTPTRELALQIREEFISFAKGLGLYSVLCIGGTKMLQQRQHLQINHNFLIGTPGRLKDLVRQRMINLNDFNNVVLDETDRMVDIGFFPDIKFLISYMPKVRQSVFFSATVSPKVQAIIQSFVQNPVSISVATKETTHNIAQETVRVSRGLKVDVLHDYLIKEEFKKTLVFGRTKHGIDKLNKELLLRGFKVSSIHGNKKQNQREKALRQFKYNEIQVLLATDVASRGLDIENVSHVINFDMPESYEDYIHRIGRTGRGTKKGTAITFVETN